MTDREEKGFAELDEMRFVRNARRVRYLFVGAGRLELRPACRCAFTLRPLAWRKWIGWGVRLGARHAVQLQLGHRLLSWDEPQNFVVCSLER